MTAFVITATLVTIFTRDQSDDPRSCPKAFRVVENGETHTLWYPAHYTAEAVRNTLIVDGKASSIQVSEIDEGKRSTFSIATPTHGE